MTMSPRRLVVGGIAAAAVIALLVVGLGGAGSSKPKPAPALPTEVLNPPQVTLASLRGHPVVLNFWAAWCGPCKQEAPELAKLSRELPGGAKLVGVDWNDNVASAKSFFGPSGWTYPILVDRSGDVGN